MSSNEVFRRCSICKTPIMYGATFYKCSVSTCNRRATALYFCSVPCWDAHVPDARHRDAWAEVETAPSGPEADSEAKELKERRVVSARPSSAGASDPAGGNPSHLGNEEPEGLPKDVLIVMSKLKAYIKARSDLRTSDGVSEALSDHLRAICGAAIKSAASNERSTVLARDIEAALRGGIASD